MMNINSAIFVPQGVPPPTILSPMPHMLAFMPPPPPTPPPPPPNIQCILQRIQHERQKQLLHERQQHIMYQHYMQQQHHIQMQQQQIYIKQQQQQQQQRLIIEKNHTHRMQEIKQIHQQQRFQNCIQNKLIKPRYMAPICFEEWSNISLMRQHQKQQLAEKKPNIEEENIAEIFATEEEYEAFLYAKEQKYQVVEQQMQNEQKIQFQKLFLTQNGTKRQPMISNYDNKKVKMQQNVAIQCGKYLVCILSLKLILIIIIIVVSAFKSFNPINIRVLTNRVKKRGY